MTSRLWIVLFLWPAWCLGQTNASSQDVYLEALRSVAYADSVKAHFERVCSQMPSLQSTSVCLNRLIVPNAVIEKVALPYFVKLVPEWAAKEVVAYYSSPKRAVLRAKLVEASRTLDTSIFTPEDNDEMERFNKTKTNAALSVFAQSREVGAAIAEAVRDYHP